VLRRVPGIQTARPLGGLDPHELRERAFRALREMLRRIADWRPLVFYIDDLQWADADSLELLLDLTREPLPPRFLLIASVRAENIASDDARGSGVVSLMSEIAARHPCERIDLGPLTDREQRQLVERMLGAQATPAMMQREFWSDSAGSPFFLGELVRYAQEADGRVDDTSPPQLDDVLYRRIEHIPDTARRVLEVIAIAGEPIALSALAAATDTNPVEAERASAVLRVGHLARVARHGQDPWLTSYHDRVRETITARLSADRQRMLHEQIAQALERSDDASVDTLARHWQAAGDAHQARAYLVTAAEAAAAKLAFGRAADLYEAAIDLTPADSAKRRTLLRAMAEALAASGRYHDAANAYTAAADGADADSATDLTRLAADNLLRSGRVTEGLAALDAVMRELGVRVAGSKRRALMSLLWQRARAAFRGTKYKPRAETEIAARDLGQLDTLYAASTSLGMIDHIRGADVQTRHLLHALRFGEERRACRALAIEAVFRASFGGRNLRKAIAISRDVEAQARRIGDPYLIAVAKLAVGATHFFAAEPRESAAAFGEARTVFRTQCVGADWERISAAYFYLQSRVQMGDLDAVAREAELLIEEADRRNDVYASNLFRTQPNTWRLLCADDPDRALRELEHALDGWPDGVYYLAHHFVTIARAIVLVYRGDAREALDVLEGAWADIVRSMISRVPWALAEYHVYKARCGFALGEEAPIRAAIKYFAGLEFTIGAGVAAALRGALAARAGDTERAQKLLIEGIGLCDKAGYGSYATAYRYRLGELTAGSEGERLRREALEWFGGKGVAAPLRMIDFYTPPFAAEDA
jgi:hypothetical protein